MASGSKLGIAVVGASMRSAIIFDYLAKHPSEGEVVGLLDLIPERCEISKRRYGMDGAKVYGSLNEALSDKRVDAVVVMTPDFAHVEPAVSALAAGKHVYCEKPLATNLADCDAIAKAANASDKIFYLGMNLRHGPVHETIHDIVASGEAGKVLLIEANEYYYGGRTYFKRWNRLEKFGGGLWITKAVHDFDLLNWMSGGVPLRVSAASNLSWYKQKPGAATRCRDCALKSSCPDFFDFAKADELVMASEKAGGLPVDLCLYNSDKDTFDNGMALVEYANDVRASYAVNVVASRDTREMRVSCTDGIVEGDMARSTVTVTKRHTGKTWTYDLAKMSNGGHGGADGKILADFFDCCRTGRKPRSSAAEGRLGVLVGLAARKACELKRTVEIKEIDIPQA